MFSEWSRPRRLALIAIGITALLIVAAVVFFLTRSPGDTVSPRVAPLTEAIYALGTVKSDQIFKLKAAIPFGVKSIAVKEGDLVKKGQTLLVMDTGSSFRSPMDGTVTAVSVNPGELVITGMPMVVVQDLNHLHIELSLDQESALRVHPAQKAELSFESIRGHRSHGEVEKIYPNEGQFIVRVTVSDLPPGVLPDMTADMAIEVARKESVLQIPLASVKNGKVIRVRDGKRSTQAVQLGMINGEWGELIKGDVIESDALVLTGR